MTIHEIKIELTDGFTSEHCSLIDDGIESATLRLDKDKVEAILEELKSLSLNIKATTYASLLYLNHVDFEFDKEPEYHRTDSITLSSDGIIRIETSSKYDFSDRFEAGVEI